MRTAAGNTILTTDYADEHGWLWKGILETVQPGKITSITRKLQAGSHKDRKDRNLPRGRNSHKIAMNSDQMTETLNDRGFFHPVSRKI
jgi:hypothetical protein